MDEHRSDAEVRRDRLEDDQARKEEEVQESGQERYDGGEIPAADGEPGQQEPGVPAPPVTDPDLPAEPAVDED